jgi:hypothetical protein
MSSVGRFKHSQSSSDKSYKLPIQIIEEPSLPFSVDVIPTPTGLLVEPV